MAQQAPKELPHGGHPTPDQPHGAAHDAAELNLLRADRDLQQLLAENRINIRKVIRDAKYERRLASLQIELVRLQRSVKEQGRRVAILFEGRDAAGKGGTIQRFAEHLNPRAMRVVALPKPTELEQGQWYFQRYADQLPNPGEITFFDRSWYNRAVVEPVMGFCSQAQYRTFMQQVPEFEHMLYEDGIELIKFWFSISKEEQAARFVARKRNPLKQWKLTQVDERAQSLWDQYTKYKEAMFSRTHTSFSPWIIVRANDKRRARLESLRYVLSTLPYSGKDAAKVDLRPDPNVIVPYDPASQGID
jgi:polyphosphate kinase 2